jgi:hypothetical protein
LAGKELNVRVQVWAIRGRTRYVDLTSTHFPDIAVHVSIERNVMKTTRLILAALALALAAACSATDITAPSATDTPTQTQRGQNGSGN